MTDLERDALNGHIQRLHHGNISERIRSIINHSPSVLEGVHRRIKTPAPKESIDDLLRNSPSRMSKYGSLDAVMESSEQGSESFI